MEKDIGKLKKNDTTDIIIRIDDFGGRKGLTIREFVTSERYTGFTKAGVRIPVSDFGKFKELIDSIEEADLEESKEDVPSPKKPKEQKTLSNEDSEDRNEMPDY